MLISRRDMPDRGVQNRPQAAVEPWSLPPDIPRSFNGSQRTITDNSWHNGPESNATSTEIINDDRRTDGPTGKEEQAPDGGADGDGSSDVCGGYDGGDE